MKQEILFSEKQKFRQWWLLLILLTTSAIFVFGVYKQVILGQQFGNKSISDAGLLTITGLILLPTILVLSSRLDTVIKSDGIYVRFFPFHLTFKHYKWGSLTKSFVREYSALIEYEGWGLRFGVSGKETAFNVSGNSGLQLEFKDHEKLLIGTNKPAELSETLTKIGQLKP